MLSEELSIRHAHGIPFRATALGEQADYSSAVSDMTDHGTSGLCYQKVRIAR